MRKLLLALCLLCLAATPALAWNVALMGGGTPVAAGGATASDDFNRSDGAIGSDWTTITGTNPLVIASNQAEGGSSGARNGNYWNADSFNVNQYSQCKIVNSVAGNAGPAVRISSSAQTFYFMASTTTDIALKKSVAGSQSTLDTFSGTYAAGGTFKLSASGTSTTTLTAYYNGGLVDSYADSSSPITTGQPGIFAYSVWDPIDDWAAGDL